MLDIYAGKTAKKIIQEQGIDAELFGAFLGASGGPKWFSLFELDKYLFGQFFKSRKRPLHLIGSSAGAYRASCLAQKDPVLAITRMADFYAESTFNPRAKPQEVTDRAVAMLDYMLGENGVKELIHNPVFKAHFLLNKTNGLVGSENKALQLLGLAKSFGFNRIDRKFIKSQYERFVFKPESSKLLIDDYCQFTTHYVNLTQENLKPALLASGSIPLVMQGVRNIQGAPKGIYRDGGLIDYHFDIEFKHIGGLILYPHFSANPKAGWFDKSLKRQVRHQSYDNVLMLVPSRQFVDLLPFSKIPDRTDFEKIPNKERIQYWKKVLQETRRLSEALDRFLEHKQYTQIKDI